MLGKSGLTGRWRLFSFQLTYIYRFRIYFNFRGSDSTSCHLTEMEVSTLSDRGVDNSNCGGREYGYLNDCHQAWKGKAQLDVVKFSVSPVYLGCSFASNALIQD